jgi:hypothetical protein
VCKRKGLLKSRAGETTTNTDETDLERIWMNTIMPNPIVHQGLSLLAICFTLPFLETMVKIPRIALDWTRTFLLSKNHAIFVVAFQPSSIGLM